jgi:two-component system LytT family response regulator
MTTRSLVIVDDEPPARAGIRHLLAAHPGWRVAAECRDGYEAIAAIETLAPDLVILDVQMPELDGFDVVECLGAAMPPVLFLTAYDEFALRAFEIHAVDYLLKPCSQARFDEALRRAELRLGDRAAATLQPILAARARDRWLIRRGQRVIVVPLEDIDWIAADDYCCTVHVGDESHVMRESLRNLEQRLDPGRFVRVHRSAIVNLERVSEIRGGADLTIVVGRHLLPVSRRRRAELLRRLGRAR